MMRKCGIKKKMCFCSFQQKQAMFQHLYTSLLVRNFSIHPVFVTWKPYILKMPLVVHLDETTKVVEVGRVLGVPVQIYTSKPCQKDILFSQKETIIKVICMRFPLPGRCSKILWIHYHEWSIHAKLSTPILKQYAEIL